MCELPSSGRSSISSQPAASAARCRSACLTAGGGVPSRQSAATPFGGVPNWVLMCASEQKSWALLPPPPLAITITSPATTAAARIPATR